MKELKAILKQLLNGVLLGALTIPLILYVISAAPTKPTLSFEGNRIVTHEDGSVQLLFDVCVSGLDYTAGAMFTLNYNREYITPSYYSDDPAGTYQANEPLLGSGEDWEEGEADSAGAFCVNPMLYKDSSGASVSPFAKGNLMQHYVNGGENTVSMYLIVDKKLAVDWTANTDTAMELLHHVGDNNEDAIVLKVDGKLVLGTLSFRVTEGADVTEIMELFNGQSDLIFEDNHAKGDTDSKLIYFTERATVTDTAGDMWAIGYWEKRIGGDNKDNYNYITIDDRNNDENAQALFSYNFPKTIIAARAANPELHLNAYQVYTAAKNDITGTVVSGTLDDIDAALQRYSPAITVTYSDGTEGNFVMPWSREGSGWSASRVTDVATATTLTNSTYDPTASYAGTANMTPANTERQYTIQKTFRYGLQTDTTDGTTTIVKTETTPTATTTVDIVDFPVPVTVDLYVMPVVLEGVTADGLERSYELNDAVSGDHMIDSFSDLKLPTQARIVTDIPVANGTLTMDVNGWSHSQSDLSGGTTYWDGADMATLLKDGATTADEHWATSDDTYYNWTDTEGSSTRGANRAGDYTFTMTTGNGTGSADTFTKSELTRAYPWLTVNGADYSLTAKRTLVWNDGAANQLVKASEYSAEHRSTDTETITVTSGVTDYEAQQPTLKLTVSRENTSLPAGSQFKIKMPDGTVIDSAWFVDGNGWMDAVQNTATSNAFYTISVNSGDSAVGTYIAEREKLRRYINQGGWFYVSVKEAVGAANETLWSDDIPVYVSPRENKYEESKVYHFFGKNGGLYPWAGGVSTTVTLPQGQYNELTNGGSGYTWTTDSTSVTGYEQADYGIKTTYNGNTGEQGDSARIYTFQVADLWTTTADKPVSGVTAYGGSAANGGDYLLDHSLNAYYGWLENELNSSDRYDASSKTAELQLENTVAAKLDEQLELHFVSTNGGARVVTYHSGNVEKVVFENREEGYTLRQTYTLELVNTGSVDIEGLSVDTLTDLAGNSDYNKGSDSDPAGGHFEILQQPAAFLPAGEKTTFVLTYVYDLKANKDTTSQNLLDYLDKIFITSNSYTADSGARIAGRDCLLSFDAQFQVADDGLHKVTVEVSPKDTAGTPLMGDAMVIVGEVGGTMDENTRSNTFAAGATVYILVEPYDEYTLKSITATNSLGNTVSVATSTTADTHGHGIYVLTMPDDDVTVKVEFEESVYSKLRLSDLRVYSDANLGNLCGTNHDLTANGAGNANWATDKVNYQQTIWQKKFPTDGENTLAANTLDNQSVENDRLALMTSLNGVADQPGYKESSWSQYLVVIPYEDDYSQVEVDLREVLHTLYGNAPLNTVNVEMLWYPTLADVAASNTVTIYDSSVTGTTNPKTTHTSDRFASPAYGTSGYVKVTTSYVDGAVTTYRSYYIELHRAPEKVEAILNYGNSPYGMIMNDDTKTAAAKENAKIAFVENNYTFKGLTATLIPAVVTKNGLESLHYWIEAWTAPTELWMAPNADWTNDYYTTGAGAALGKTGNDAISVYDDETGMSKALYLKLSNKAEVTTTAADGTTATVLTAVGTENDDNLDLNSYSFFAVMGEEFTDAGLKSAKDSSGREVAPTDIVITLENVDTLDTSANANTSADQVARFTAAGAVNITLKQADGTAATSGTTVASTWAATDAAGNTVELRPGRYKLTYTFEDYNHTAADPHYLVVERDFVILAPVGDVNADGSAASADSELIEQRYSVNLGHPALGYMTYTDDAIFKLRTVDANNDRNINNADANTIQKGTAVEKFYLPTDYKTAGTSFAPSTP